MPIIRASFAWAVINFILSGQLFAADSSNSLALTGYSVYQAPIVIELNEREQYQIDKHQSVLKKYFVDGVAKHVIVFRVKATKQDIWQTITDYQYYPDWVKGVKKTKVYKSDSQNYYVDFLVGHWLLGRFQYSVHHYLSNDSWMKWQLDKSKLSDFTFATGFWRVKQVRNQENMCDVFYSADLQFKQKKSGYTRKKVIRTGLKQTSLWLTREAEKLSRN